MAAIAASASGARPRLVCSTTPVALITGASDGSANRSTAVRTAASHPSGGAVPPLARALSTATRAAFTTSARGWSARRAAMPGPASSESTEGRFRLGSLIWEVDRGWWRLVEVVEVAEVVEDVAAPGAWCRPAQASAP